MTELELYKFINDNGIEWHREDNPHILDIQEFHQTLLPSSILDDGGIECRMKDGYFCFWMKDICDYFGIDINNVFIEGER